MWFLAFLFLSCHGTTHASKVEMPYIHPMILHEKPDDLYLLDRSKIDNKVYKNKVVSKKGEDEVLGQPHEVGTQKEKKRGLILESARRILGIKNSFDDRSFIGHVLFASGYKIEENDIKSMNANSIIQVMKLKDEKQYQAKPGDLVLFRCPQDCGIMVSNNMAVGVVEKSQDICLSFISYIDSEVKSCQYKCKGDCVVDEIMGFVDVTEQQDIKSQIH